MISLSSTTIRTALVDYRAELLRLVVLYPKTFGGNRETIAQIDGALLSIEGNIQDVGIVPLTCSK